MHPFGLAVETFLDPDYGNGMLNKTTWKDRKAVIIGAARQGLALAGYLAKHGATVVVNDHLPERDLLPRRQMLSEHLAANDHAVEWVCGSHPIDILNGADTIFVSGGVPLSLSLIQEAKSRGIPLSNDSQLFLETAPCKVIGITGSAGKTTTTSLVGSILREAYSPGSTQIRPRNVWVGGNIGEPLLTKVDEMAQDDLAVMELSSFQLELMTRSPQHAVVLNITPNHLDRHGTMQAYIDVKARILKFQSREGIAVLGRDDNVAWGLAPDVGGKLVSFGESPLPEGEGTFLKDNDIYYHCNEGNTRLMSCSDIPLRGEHNVQNVLAAAAISIALGISPQRVNSGVKSFSGIVHRLEYVRSWGGAAWYNDSIATAPERAMAAIRSFENPIILLAGGRDKDLPWEDFAALVNEHVKHIVVFGEAAEKISAAVHQIKHQIGDDSIRPHISQRKGMRDAVAEAALLIESGDVVLLSPGGTSYDEFRDFEERGECFKKLVMNL
jgi:UDP-N-acetylmuramoylalanine--D-glutamate ligase